MMQKIEIKQKHYVYSLSYPDGTVFYIGKGSSLSTPRIASHMRQALRGMQTEKCEVIRQILAKGEEMLFTILAEYDLETDAFAHESRLIKQYGDAITNVSRRGRSCVKEDLSPFGIVFDSICQQLDIDWQDIVLRSKVNQPTLSKSTHNHYRVTRETVAEIHKALREFIDYQPEWEQALFNAAGFATEAQMQGAVQGIAQSHPQKWEGGSPRIRGYLQLLSAIAKETI